MHLKIFNFIFIFLWISLLCLAPFPASANNLLISNVSLEDRDSTLKTAIVEFDISWDNSWRTTTNHDAVWLFLKVSINGGTPVHGVLYASGADPSGTSFGSMNKQIEIIVPSDKNGAFIRWKAPGSGTVASSNVRLKLDYGATGAVNTDTILVKVFGTEMVYIPAVTFNAGDNAASTASLKAGSASTTPWSISSEAAISVTAATGGGYYYVSGGNTGEAATGSTFTIPAAFPKGYAAFYCMKYEITEGQWVDFFKNLSTAARLNRDLTDSSHKNSDAVVNRNTLSCTLGAGVLVCSTTRPDRALGYLTWMDVMAFLDWASLRPMTELEFEKTARGPLSAVSNEFAWGNGSTPGYASTISGPEDGTETITYPASASACNGSVTFTGGDAGTGPLRGGIFATASSTRVTSGAGYYGVMELSGNVVERTVTIGNATGRSFTGTHGDGVLTTTASYEGNATNTDWPGIDIDTTTARGVTGATGGGLRGGGWNYSNAQIQVSDRSVAAQTSAVSAIANGGRGVRTCSDAAPLCP